MKKLIFLVLFVSLLPACNLKPESKESPNRFYLHTNSGIPNDVYVVDAQRGRVWKLVFNGVNDETTGFYPLKFKELYGLRGEFEYEAVKVESLPRP